MAVLDLGSFHLSSLNTMTHHDQYKLIVFFPRSRYLSGDGDITCVQNEINMTCRRAMPRKENGAGVVLQGRFFVVGGRIADVPDSGQFWNPDMWAAEEEEEEEAGVVVREIFQRNLCCEILEMKILLVGCAVLLLVQR